MTLRRDERTIGPVAAIVYFAIGTVGTCMEILYTLAEAQAAAG